jgi:general L-amino acid transport system substrate-binding protein
MSGFLQRAAFFAVLTTSPILAAGAFAGPTLDAVKARGQLACGVSQGLPGFSNPDDKGNWQGIDADYCRAVAAAVLGSAAKVKYTALSAKERFTALQSGEVDILSRNTTWTITRDAGLGLVFAGVIYYDGQGFMVRKSLNVKSAKELDGAQVCMNAGTTTELNAADFFRTNKLKFQPVVFEKSDETVAAYEAGRCDAYSTDASGLYGERLKLKNKDEHIVLPEIISKEPLGPAVRQGDDQWLNIARWTLYAMIGAEEYGVTAQNVEQMRAGSVNPEIRRLLGVEARIGTQLGLADSWAYEVVRQVGNYGEVFERNVGPKTPLGIARGLNRLWTEGGLMYAPPIR